MATGRNYRLLRVKVQDLSMTVPSGGREDRAVFAIQFFTRSFLFSFYFFFIFLIFPRPGKA